MKRKNKTVKEVCVVLHNIRSVHNVASIFRTADCLGVTEIMLVGYTPAPADRFGRPRKDFAKVALGAEQTIGWRSFKTAAEAFRFLRARGVFVVGVEQSPRAKDYRKVKPRFPAAFIFGNEVEGIPATLLKKCDVVAEIPLRGTLARNRLVDDGGKESLNVSVAAGIALAFYSSFPKGGGRVCEDGGF